MIMDSHTQLARRTVEVYAGTRKTISVPEGLPQEFYSCHKGVFVTIYKMEDNDKHLRGCMGTFLPCAKNIAEEIIRNAICASRQDDRFLPVVKNELAMLSYEVSLLDTPEKIYTTEDLDPRKYGVIIKSEDGRAGLLLPDIQGVDAPLHQVQIAAQKGCIDFHAESFSLFRFTVEKHKE